MKIIFAGAALLSLGLATPAFAGEANYEPFNNNRSTLSTTYTGSSPMAVTADTGSAQYPSTPGRPGTALLGLNNDVLPSNGSEGAVQTANSLPRGFEQGTVTYAQARSVQNWLVAHSSVSLSRTAAR